MATSLTGIKPTGNPHLGNYLGAIAPALELAEKNAGFYFIADYHALTTMHDPQELKESVLNVAATLLALGFDPDKVVFYRQSEVPEIFELSWALSCYTPKGFMNRAHAYKDAIARNCDAGEDTDAGVNMGLFGYPVLMNADILLFGSDLVPVGKDQKQHVEFARDIAVRFNKKYGVDLFQVPEPVIRQELDVVTGLDGRKMSKSYDNTIEIFLPSKQLKKKVNRIKTNSQGIDEKKNPDECNIFSLYRLFASEEEQTALADRYRAGGMGWGEAKSALFEVLEKKFGGETREEYNRLLSNPQELEKILATGAQKARTVAKPFMEKFRKTIGITG